MFTFISGLTFVVHVTGAVKDTRKLPGGPVGCASALTGDNRLMRESNGRLLRQMQGYIDERRRVMAAGEMPPMDILQSMLTSKDKVTGRTMPDELIINNLYTFLVAGHETTAGMLTYAVYELLRHPEALARLVAEADAVLGCDFTRAPTLEDADTLVYTQWVCKEALRLHPTAGAFSKVRELPAAGPQAG